MNELKLPPYTYVPGQTPHPISDPLGHMYEEADNLKSLTEAEALHRGQRLFNHGYYWEAHEAWEHAWHLLGRVSPAANFAKGLIKLAAAGVKCLEANPVGVQRHATRAKELFTNLNDLDFPPNYQKGPLLENCRVLLESPPLLTNPSNGKPVVLNGLNIPANPVDQIAD